MKPEYLFWFILIIHSRSLAKKLQLGNEIKPSLFGGDDSKTNRDNINLNRSNPNPQDQSGGCC